eukprot:7462092-Alexandrium_andersonii.AAC.1
MACCAGAGSGIREEQSWMVVQYPVFFDKLVRKLQWVESPADPVQTCLIPRVAPLPDDSVASQQ